jgi:glutathione S-transferase
MKLYVDSQFASPYALTAYVSLVEKGCAFDIETIDLAAKAHHASSFVASSMTRRVPTLIHDDFALSESSAIAEYLNDAVPGPALYPENVRDRARARQFQAWLRSDLNPIREERPSMVVFYGTRYAPLSASALDSAALLFVAIDGVLAEGAANLFGWWSIADVDVAMMLNRLIMHGDDVPKRLVAYAAHQWRRPSLQAWLNKTDYRHDERPGL